MIILASASKRRIALLTQMGLEFSVMESNIDESIPEGMNPNEAVKLLSKMKAENVYGKLNKNAVIVAADTVVYANGRILGKPSDDNDAFFMLKNLSGKKHCVYTGLTVIKKNDNNVFSETIVDSTDVYMRELTDDEIWAYIKTGEPSDKAGAYGIQGRGAVFVERIDGDFYTVVGLPLVKLNKLLGAGKNFN